MMVIYYNWEPITEVVHKVSSYKPDVKSKRNLKWDDLDSFRCIKLRVELDRKSTHEIDWFRQVIFHTHKKTCAPPHTTICSYQSFQSLQYLTSHTPTSTMLGGTEFGSSSASSASYVMEDKNKEQQQDLSSELLIKDCCICLYAVAPLQALFVAPCQHTFHYKCIRPLLNHYPGFQCPCCRNYSDLESPVTIEKSEVCSNARMYS